MKRLIASIASLLTCLFPTLAQTATAHTSLKHPDWSRSAVIYEVNTRQYTPEGTFKAFKAHLPRLKELGVDILWFMPIHPISEKNRKGELGSYYAAADYKAVNPEFGTLDDFRHLVRAAHDQGMKVIIDWVPNHTGCDNVWVSEHPEFYKRNDKGEMFGPFDWTDVYELDYSNPATRHAMIDAMSFWLKEAGIDGFRCDVAGRVPVSFWDEARAVFDASTSEPVFMLAEATEPELMANAFDMDYNWPMKDLFSHIAATAGQYSFRTSTPPYPEKHAADIATLLTEQAKTYPADSYMMNMTSNHDLNSWEGTERERLGIFAPAFAVISYTLPGMPLIYTGQEAGLDRALEFFVKDTPPAWEPRAEVFDFYKKLNTLKHSRPELAAGEKGGVTEMLDTADRDAVAYLRKLGASGTFTAANLGTKPSPAIAASAKLPFDSITDAFTGKTITAAELRAVTLQPGQYIAGTY